jgi:hypothetical protein
MTTLLLIIAFLVCATASLALGVLLAAHFLGAFLDWLFSQL